MAGDPDDEPGKRAISSGNCRYSYGRWGRNAASQDAAVGSRSRALGVIASPTAKRGDGADRFRPDIEGMRAIAVGLVLLFHGYGKPFTGGFVGVDVFFVISGFLITSLLLHEQIKDGRISVWCL